MFTGLIEKTGKLTRLIQRGNGYVLTIEHAPWKEPLVKGESVSVSGACLTVTGSDGKLTEFDVLAETVERTCLKGKHSGSIQNLERALRAGDRLGGHIVTGHIDGIGTIQAIEKSGDDHIITIRCNSDIMDGIVKKGSVAIDGTSLTIADITANTFSVHIIPTTWRETSLADMKAGDYVNIETDLIGKYVKKYCGNSQTDTAKFNPALF